MSDDDSDKEEEMLARLLASMGLFRGTMRPSARELAEDNAICKTLGTDLTVEAVGRALADGRIKNVVVMAGAGISTSCGIPDFRSPGTGLYSNLQRFDLPHPQAVFELDFFRSNPRPFYTLARELYPGNFNPSPTHHFIKLLSDKGVLLRCFTQNIDTLERRAGVPADKVVEAHGSFAEAHCIDCDQHVEEEFVRKHVFSEKITIKEADGETATEVSQTTETSVEVPRCVGCSGLVKPRIVFFGESLPARFFELSRDDLPKADLLLVMGTSLQVRPFSELIHDVDPGCVRILSNLEPVGLAKPPREVDGERVRGHGFRFGMHDNIRDIGVLGPCDDFVEQLAKAAGWEDDFKKLLSNT